jgi:hypothetical protein
MLEIDRQQVYQLAQLGARAAVSTIFEPPSLADDHGLNPALTAAVRR